MSRFIQLHLLTSYPPCNLNRDDQGRPKTAKMGGYDRLRVSSQCLKRTWRTSDLFQSSLNGNLGERTKLFGIELFRYFIEKEIKFKNAIDWSIKIASIFGKPESPTDLRNKKTAAKEKIHGKLLQKWSSRNSTKIDFTKYSLKQLNSLEAIEISQLSFISPEEKKAAFELADRLIEDSDYDFSADVKLLRKDTQAVDIGLFGRMLADAPDRNIEAACQVAHAISVHPIVIEDDYFTAVEEMSEYRADAGAAHIGETRFSSGLFYSYICINRELLSQNLNSDTNLANRAIRALIEAAVKVAPQGKQNSFASRAYASYVLVEKGNQQPRSLSVAFLKPIKHPENSDYIRDSIVALKKQCESFDNVYGACADESYELNVPDEKGNLVGLLNFVAG